LRHYFSSFSSFFSFSSVFVVFVGDYDSTVKMTLIGIAHNSTTVPLARAKITRALIGSHGLPLSWGTIEVSKAAGGLFIVRRCV